MVQIKNIWNGARIKNKVNISGIICIDSYKVIKISILR